MIHLPRIEAEIAAWPFWSERAMAPGITALRWNAQGNLDGTSQRCYDDLEAYLRLRASGASLETLRMLRDRMWGGAARSRQCPLHDLLTDVAGSLHPADPACCEDTAGERWLWMTLAMPLDLLMAVLPAGQPTPAVPEALSQVLEKGVAQIHVHLGACMSFATLWQHLMVSAGGRFLDGRTLQSGGPPPFGSGESFRRWLIGAALVRTTLAGFLHWHALGRLHCVAQLANAAWPTAYEREQHRDALRAFLCGEASLPAERMARLVRRLGNTPGTGIEVRSLAELRARDPVQRWLQPPEGCDAEAHLLRRCIEYIRSSDDADFACLFWQYVRVRGRTYRHIVQEPGTAGLAWFSTHFQRIRGLRSGLSQQARMEAAYELESKNLHLDSLEVRETPESSAPEIRAIVERVVKARPCLHPPESGLVLHFKKEWRDRLHRPHGDPQRVSVPGRYGLYALKRLREVRAIRDAIRRQPRLLIWLRGLDVCSEELSVPNWVLLPMLGRLRAESDHIAEEQRQRGTELEGLRMTLHCGEEFRSLNEGLRRLHEPIAFGYLCPRDRVGHALALGIDVERYVREQPYVVERAEDRLDNLLWELSLYDDGTLRPEGDRRQAVEREIARVSRRIYCEDFALDVQVEAWRLRLRGLHIDRWRYPRMYKPTAHTTTERILLATLQHPCVYERGQRPVQVDNQQEYSLLRSAQRMLQQQFRARAITVEANPSSNLLIGHFAELSQLPMFRLAAPERTDDESALSVGIADDDPLTFATSLHEEYVHAFSALLRLGRTEAQALTWIEQRRQNAVTARFTLSDSATATLRGD